MTDWIEVDTLHRRNSTKMNLTVAIKEENVSERGKDHRKRDEESRKMAEKNQITCFWLAEIDWFSIQVKHIL